MRGINTEVPYAAYIDDFTFFSDDARHLEKLSTKLEKHFNAFGLELNHLKTQLGPTRHLHSKKLVRLCNMSYIDTFSEMYIRTRHVAKVREFKKYTKHHSPEKIRAKFLTMPKSVKTECRLIYEYLMLKSIYTGDGEDWRCRYLADINGRGTVLLPFSTEYPTGCNNTIAFSKFSSFAEAMNSTVKTARIYFKYQDLKYLLNNSDKLLEGVLSVTKVEEVDELNILQILREFHYKIGHADLNLLFDILAKFHSKTRWIVSLLKRRKDRGLYESRIAVACESEFFKYRWEM